MVTTSETGHSKNVANLDGMTIVAESLGTDYNPVQPAIQIPVMKDLSVRCASSIFIVKTCESAYKTALDSREEAFRPLNQIVSRIGNFLKASNVTGHVFDSIMLYVRKIQGRRNVKNNVESISSMQPATRSTSQMSFDNKIAHLDGIIQALSGIPSFTPNEKIIQVESLKAFSDDLKRKNAAVLSTQAELRKARAARNELMYKPVTGMVDIAIDAKMYIKSVFGAKSPQYKQVSKLKFVKIRA